jgi:hypothetical protein
MPGFIERAKSSWNAFFNKDPTANEAPAYGYTVSSSRPDRLRITHSNERSVVGPIYNRIAVDVASLDFRHAKVNDNGQFVDTINDELNDVLTLNANLDQTSDDLIRDAVMSMFDEGVVAIFPAKATADPWLTDSFKVQTARVGTITQWYPNKVKVDAYNEATGNHQEIMIPKRSTCIIQNPFYHIMNAPNSNLKRLVTKMNLLDQIDAKTASPKLDLIIQLPYSIKTKTREDQAERRRESLVEQLRGSELGIGYIDGTEKITQLNRSIESTLPAEIEKLKQELYAQLGLTPEVFNGTANESTMLNYYTRTIEPIASAIVLEMRRKWLSKTARSQNQSIVFFRDPFKLVPISNIAEITEKLITSEVVTANEMRGVIGLKPSGDPRADQLMNPNINPAADNPVSGEGTEEDVPVEDSY